VTLLAILTAFALVLAWAWFLNEVRNRRAVRRPTWQEEMDRLAEAFRELQKAMGIPLLEATRRASEAMKQFAAAWAKPPLP
jgi:hypothetical protein